MLLYRLLRSICEVFPPECIHACGVTIDRSHGVTRSCNLEPRSTQHRAEGLKVPTAADDDAKTRTPLDPRSATKRRISQPQIMTAGPKHDWNYEVATRKSIDGTEFQLKRPKRGSGSAWIRAEGPEKGKMRVQEQDARRRFQISTSRDRSPEDKNVAAD